MRHTIPLALSGLLVILASLSTGCGSNTSSEPSATPAPGSDAAGEGTAPIATDAGMPSLDGAPHDTGTSAESAADVSLTSGPCSATDPDRLFWNDFEDGRFYADPDAGQTYDPSRDYVDVKPAQF